MKKLLLLMTGVVMLSSTANALTCNCSDPASQSRKECFTLCNACPKGMQLTADGKCVSVCSAKQYVNPSTMKCAACPANATCDGKNAKCNAGYVHDSSYKGAYKCVARPGIYGCKGVVNGYKTTAEACSCSSGLHDGKKCIACVNDKKGNAVDSGCKANAPLCNGAEGKVGTACLRISCAKNQYLDIFQNTGNGGTCKKCPANATCDGKNAKCNAGYENIGRSEVKCVAKSCAKNQHLENGVCKECPKNATCNGKDFSCKSYTYNKAHHACDDPHCDKGEYWNIANCEKCPKHATCDGEKVIKCESGFKLTGNKCVQNPLTCSKNQYIRFDSKKDREVCEACPKGATCDGKNPKCPKGYTKDSEGRVICNLVTCSKNQYLRFDKKQNREICEACPKGATCDGKNAKCPNGYTKDSEGRVICKVKMCEKGSHDSVAFIRKNYKNCTSCRTENIAAGKCAKNKKAHKHYYCKCEC